MRRCRSCRLFDYGKPEALSGLLEEYEGDYGAGVCGVGCTALDWITGNSGGGEEGKCVVAAAPSRRPLAERDHSAQQGCVTYFADNFGGNPNSVASSSPDLMLFSVS